MKNILFVLIALMGFSLQANADWARTPAPYGRSPYYPNPGYYPAPMPTGFITCFTQGMGNGAYFYGIGMNQLVANQWAHYACNSTGQYCVTIGCRY